MKIKVSLDLEIKDSLVDKINNFKELPGFIQGITMGIARALIGVMGLKKEDEEITSLSGLKIQTYDNNGEEDKKLIF